MSLALLRPTTLRQFGNANTAIAKTVLGQLSGLNIQINRSRTLVQYVQMSCKASSRRVVIESLLTSTARVSNSSNSKLYANSITQFQSRPYSENKPSLTNPHQNKLDQPSSNETLRDVEKTDTSTAKDTKPTTPHENIYTLPNFLTLTRLISAPVIGYLVVHQQLNWAASLFVYSCLTDYVDGYLARRWKLQTVVGSVIDPMADKMLMVTLASCLAASGDIPVYMAVLILGRDFLLALSALYYRYISLPPPKTFARYWDFSIPSAEVHPTTISKYNTFFQMLYLGSALMLPVTVSALQGTEYANWIEYLQFGLKGIEYTVATTTVLSGLSYVFSKNAVKILKQK